MQRSHEMVSASSSASQQSGLADDQIVFFLRETMGLQVTKELLQKPTPSFMMTVFQSFLSDFYVDSAAVDQPAMTAATSPIFNYYETCEDAIPLVNIVMFMRPFMEHFNIKDFSITDILEPKPKRTRRLLSHLMLFWKFATDKMQEFHAANIRQKEKVEGKKGLQTEKENLEKGIQEMQMQMIKLETKKQQGKKKVLDKTQELAMLQQTVEEVRERYASVKQEAAEVTESLEDEFKHVENKKEVLCQLRLPNLKPNESLKEMRDELKEKHEGLVLKRKNITDKVLEMTKDIERKMAFKMEMQNAHIVGKAAETLEKLKEKAVTLKQLNIQMKQAEEELLGRDTGLTKQEKSYQTESEGLMKEIQLAQRHKEELKLAVDDSENYLAALREKCDRNVKFLNDLTQEKDLLQKQISQCEKKAKIFEEHCNRVGERIVQQGTEMQLKVQRTLDETDEFISKHLKNLAK